MSRPGDLGFLAAPDEVVDWRLVVLVDAAAAAGLLEALPGTAEELGDRLDLDAHAVRVVLQALREWDVVEVEAGRFRLGEAAPDGDALGLLRDHARTVRRWSGGLADRLAGRPRVDGAVWTPQDRDRWLRSLGAHARERAPEVVDRCLARFPETRRVLDLAGGHGEYGLEFARRGAAVTLQDLAETIEVVGRWPSVRDSDLELFGGDVFERLPEGPFDLVLCAGFSHTLDGARVGQLLRRLAGVTAPSGGVAVHTLLRGWRPAAPIFAVQMLLADGGGDTHGEDDYRRWLRAAGYGAVDVLDVEGRALLLAGRSARAGT